MGQVAAVSCYVYWGLIVVYWTWLDKVESQELLMHRVVWTLLIVFALMAIRGNLKDYWRGFTSGRVFRTHLLGAALPLICLTRSVTGRPVSMSLGVQLA